MTINRLIQLLQDYKRRHGSDVGERELLVWLPGSRIELSNLPFSDTHGRVLIEGNLKEGSALS